MHDPGQHFGNFDCICILEVNDPDITGLLQRRIQIRHQLPYTVDGQLVSRHHHAVGALVRHQHCFFVRLSALALPRFFEGVKHGDHIFCHTIFQANDFCGLNRGAVHALNNVDDATNIGTDIGDDDSVAGRIRCHVGLLRHERP